MRSLRLPRYIIVSLCLTGMIAAGQTAAAEVMTTGSLKKSNIHTLIEGPAGFAKNLKANLILLVGGNGVLKLSTNGNFKQKHKNFLVRSRRSFHAGGFLTAVPDAPLAKQNKKGLKGLRVKAWHAKDLTRIVRKLKARNGKPVFVIGTSRGTISAASLAARQDAGRIDGVILTSTVLVGKDHLSINGIRMTNIKVPVLIVHHQKDACPKTPFPLAKKLAAKLRSAGRSVTFKGVLGGRTKGKSKRCKGSSHHGFLGIEHETVALITDWINSRL